MCKIWSHSQRLPICLLATRPQLSVLQSQLPTRTLRTHNKPTECCQANQLASIEEDLAQIKEIVEKFKVESGLPVCVMSALTANIEFWKSIGALYFILSIIENGYKLPFACYPEPVKVRNNKSAGLHDGFVDRVIYDPLSVSIQPCGKRLILVLHHVNV